MTTSPDTETPPESGFVCECNSRCRSACIGEPPYGDYDGYRYCVLHFPGKEKSVEFRQVLERKIAKSDFDFRGVWFPDDIRFVKTVFNTPAHFSDATFSGTANFFDATFNALANFNDATFNSDAYFFAATFNENAEFSYVKFNESAGFAATHFKKDADFFYATFKGMAGFLLTRFDGLARFRGADFVAQARFGGDDGENIAFTDVSSLDMQFGRVENPEDICFQTLRLRPHWFVNIDSSKFEFTNVDWYWRSTRKEIASLKHRSISLPHRMLSIGCRHLALNAEENHRYEDASRFRYMSMDAGRLEHWSGFDFTRLSWWYWLASGYGERIVRAGVVLIGILLVCAVLYTQVGFARWEPKSASESDAVVAIPDETGAPLKLSRGLTYSAAVMTLQRPEPQPATTAAQIVVLLETILGPVQAALLALAIRRKFMR